MMHTMSLDTSAKPKQRAGDFSVRDSENETSRGLELPPPAHLQWEDDSNTEPINDDFSDGVECSHDAAASYLSFNQLSACNGLK